MASVIKKALATTNPYANHVLSLMGLDPGSVAVVDYSYCQSQDELEFALFSDFVQSGVSSEDAAERAKELAKDMWERK